MRGALRGVLVLSLAAGAPGFAGHQLRSAGSFFVPRLALPGRFLSGAAQRRGDRLWAEKDDLLEEIQSLEREKADAVADEDYLLAHDIKSQIETMTRKLDDLGGADTSESGHSGEEVFMPGMDFNEGTYVVALERPLGLTIELDQDDDVFVKAVRGNAEQAGVEAGDYLVGLGSFFDGDAMFPVPKASDGATSIEQVEKHMQYCESQSQVRLQFRRKESVNKPSEEDRLPGWLQGTEDSSGKFKYAATVPLNEALDKIYSGQDEGESADTK